MRQGVPKTRRYIVFVVFFFYGCLVSQSVLASAGPVEVMPYSMKQVDKNIEKIIKKKLKKAKNKTERLRLASAAFLNKPYQLGALGEGKQGEFDQEPLYRTDAFDCLTYVSTVLAIANATSLDEFKQAVLAIRYADAQPTYQTRNHFTSVDWNINNFNKGYVKDITWQIRGEGGRPLARLAKTPIDKKSWYEHKSMTSLHLLPPFNRDEADAKLKALRHLSQKVDNVESALPYIPLAAWFDEKQRPNNTLFDQIPSGSIIEIVRPGWDLTQQIGTPLNVTHLGFAFRTSNGLMYREASQLAKKVIDIDLAGYLRAYLSHKQAYGINIQLADF